MMPAVPGGPDVRVPAGARTVGGSASSDAANAPAMGAKVATRGVDGSGTGGGDGFGAVMQAAMGHAPVRGRAGGRNPVEVVKEAAGESAKPGGVPLPANPEAGSAALAGEKQAVLAHAIREAGKGLPVGTNGAGAGPLAPTKESRMAEGASGAGQSAALGVGQAAAPGAGQSQDAAKCSAKDAAAGKVAQRKIGNLETTAAEKVANTVTDMKPGTGSAVAHMDPAVEQPAAGLLGTGSGVAQGTSTGKAGPKTDAKKDAGKQQAKGRVTGQIVQPGVMTVAMVAPIGVSGGAARVAASRHGRPGRVPGEGQGRIEGKVGSVVVPGRGIATARGSTAGRSAVSAKPSGNGAQGMVAGLAAGGAGGTVNPADAGNLVPAGIAAGAGSHGHTAAGHDARASLAQAEAGWANPPIQSGTPKNSSTGAAASGFTASLLQGHSGIAAAHHGSHPGAGTAGGVGAANPYARMDETHGQTLVYALPQKMSVAVTDPSLGSFQVRAQGAGTQIAASLATASAATHAQLSAHLPSLTAFLQDQRVDLTRVTVVQQGLLGGDAGSRDFGGQQRQSRSGGRGARSQSARVGAVGAVDASTEPVEVSGAAGPVRMVDSGAGAVMPAAQGSLSRGTAGGGVVAVDLMA